MDRRALLGLGLAATLPVRALADDAPPFALWPRLTLPLWPGMPPGGEGIHPILRITERSKTPDIRPNRAATGIAVPDLTVYPSARPDGSALILAPGGGYEHLAFDKEGADVAQVLGASGVTCFVLRYRLPHEGWADKVDVPLQDAQRAIRLVRANADKFGINPARTGIMGFSAGGHLAGSLATRHGEKVYAPFDAADSLSARPDFVGLMYPALHLTGSGMGMLGPSANDAMRAAYSPELHVDAATPPGFIVQAADDPQVPISNSLSMFAALRAANVAAELHMFEQGGHGFGISDTISKPDSAWPDLFLRWASSHGWVKGPASVPT
jgi:acetyl esterase/lipase